MITAKQARLRRATKTRARIQRLDINRLSVFRTPQHIYAQVISPDGAKTLVSASSLEKEIATQAKQENKTACAARVGQLLAARALKKNITEVAFDRAGFKYHGRVKQLAEAAREGGLKF